MILKCLILSRSAKGIRVRIGRNCDGLSSVRVIDGFSVIEIEFARQDQLIVIWRFWLTPGKETLISIKQPIQGIREGSACSAMIALYRRQKIHNFILIMIGIIENVIFLILIMHGSEKAQHCDAIAIEIDPQLSDSVEIEEAYLCKLIAKHKKVYAILGKSIANYEEVTAACHKRSLFLAASPITSTLSSLHQQSHFNTIKHTHSTKLQLSLKQKQDLDDRLAQLQQQTQKQSASIQQSTHQYNQDLDLLQHQKSLLFQQLQILRKKAENPLPNQTNSEPLIPNHQSNQENQEKSQPKGLNFSRSQNTQKEVGLSNIFRRIGFANQNNWDHKKQKEENQKVKQPPKNNVSINPSNKSLHSLWSNKIVKNESCRINISHKNVQSPMQKYTSDPFHHQIKQESIKQSQIKSQIILIVHLLAQQDTLIENACKNSSHLLGVKLRNKIKDRHKNYAHKLTQLQEIIKKSKESLHFTAFQQDEAIHQRLMKQFETKKLAKQACTLKQI